MVMLVSDMLDRKYSNLEQQTAADMIRSQAAAQLARAQASVVGSNARSEQELNAARTGHINAQTGEVAADSASNRALQGSQGTENNSRAALNNANTKEVSANAAAQRGLAEAQAGNYNATAANTNASTTGLNWLNKQAPSLFTQGMPSRRPLLGSDIGPGYGFNYARGTARVPGRGDGTRDTEPAMLAPGEAVLNKSAADTMGRGLIAALNQLGAARMGLV